MIFSLHVHVESKDKIFQHNLRFPYYDVEEEDKDEDEENETNFNKRASTYARTQTSSQIGRPEQRRSCPENRSERILPRDG